MGSLPVSRGHTSAQPVDLVVPQSVRAPVVLAQHESQRRRELPQVTFPKGGVSGWPSVGSSVEMISTLDHGIV